MLKYIADFLIIIGIMTVSYAICTFLSSISDDMEQRGKTNVMQKAIEIASFVFLIPGLLITFLFVPKAKKHDKELRDVYLVAKMEYMLPENQVKYAKNHFNYDVSPEDFDYDIFKKEIFDKMDFYPIYP